MKDKASTEDELFDRFGKRYDQGTVLFREGDPGHEMYVIQTGRVQLTRHVRGRETHLATLPPGEFFGEMAILNNQPRSATATIIEPARLLALDGRTFEAMIRGNAEIAVRLIKKLSLRLQQANAQVEVLLREDTNHRLVQHLRHLAHTVGSSEGDGPGIRVDVSVEEIADEINVPPQVARECLDRLERARLIVKNMGSIFIAEVGRLGEFLEFLEMKERFGG
jgi:CRP-like cAMP-binding protein